MEFKRNHKYFYWGLTLLAVVLVSVLFCVIITNFHGFFKVIRDMIGVLSPVICGIVFAYLLNPLVNIVDRYLLPRMLKKSKKPEKTKKLSRALGIVFSLIVAGVLIYGLIYLVIPQLYDTIVSIVSNMPVYLRKLERWILAILEDNPDLRTAADSAMNKIADYLVSWLGPDGKFFENVQTVIIGVTGAAVDVVKGLLNLLIGLVASVYMLWSKNTFQAQAKKIVVAVFRPRAADRVLHIGRETHRIFSGFIIGKLIDSLIIGILCYIGMRILRLPFAMLIATVVGVTNVIPFFGPIIGIVPSALLLLLVNPLQSFYFVVFALILQQIDGNIIGPRILGDTIGISGFWVLVSITVAGNLFGFAGMLLGVPVFAVLYTLLRDVVNASLRKKKQPSQTELYYDIQSVSELSTETEEDPNQIRFSTEPEPPHEP